MNRQIFESLKIVKNSHQNILGIIFYVILTLFFCHNSLFIPNIKVDLSYGHFVFCQKFAKRPF